ncbi:MAG: single-stranded DNA-binding protein [Synergistaceae bacterium]|nr:single-stranded DNA-binding protein [Synergistaceae bacterium]MBR0034532.1 single-stranded DNA-binding protein [Synergistaceae bacterium]
MRGFNRAIIAGNLARDPDVRHTLNKKTFARFTVAVNNRYKDANGEYQDNADYIAVVAWGNLAEIAEKYLKKGSPVLIEGRIRTGSYDAKDGSGKKYTTEIWVDNMIMLGSREGVSGSAGGFSAGGSSSGMDSYSQSGMPDGFGSNIGDQGFGGSTSIPDFGSSRNSMSEPEGAGIPF